MSVIKDEFAIAGGYCPNGEKTSSLLEYTEKWNNFKEEISTLLNANCSLSNAFERPFMPKSITVISKSNQERFNLPVWAAKKMLHNDYNYVIAEHKLNEIINLNSSDLYKKILIASHNNNQDFIEVILKDSNFKEKFDEKLVNNLLSEFCRMNYVNLVKILYSQDHLKDLVNINKSYDPFFIACLDGHIETVQFLTESKESKKFKFPIDSKLLILGIEATIEKGKLELTKLLLENPEIMKKININDLKINLTKKITNIEDEETKNYLLNGILKNTIKKHKF